MVLQLRTNCEIKYEWMNVQLMSLPKYPMSTSQIEDRNDQEKNNTHNQTQGGTNTIKTINVANRCFD
jgi:hypothetical protein